MDFIIISYDVSLALSFFVLVLTYDGLGRVFGIEADFDVTLL